MELSERRAIAQKIRRLSRTQPSDTFASRMAEIAELAKGAKPAKAKKVSVNRMEPDSTSSSDLPDNGGGV